MLIGLILFFLACASFIYALLSLYWTGPAPRDGGS